MRRDGQTIFDALSQAIGRREELITFVADRPGHDLCYAINPTLIVNEIGWRPRETFQSGLRKTVAWYLANSARWRKLRDGIYAGKRLGAPA
jgi:dTDP-glucose 4,6-dehydratase